MDRKQKQQQNQTVNFGRQVGWWHLKSVGKTYMRLAQDLQHGQMVRRCPAVNGYGLRMTIIQQGKAAQFLVWNSFIVHQVFCHFVSNWRFREYVLNLIVVQNRVDRNNVGRSYTISYPVVTHFDSSLIFPYIMILASDIKRYFHLSTSCTYLAVWFVFNPPKLIFFEIIVFC